MCYNLCIVAHHQPHLLLQLLKFASASSERLDQNTHSIQSDSFKMHSCRAAHMGAPTNIHAGFSRAAVSGGCPVLKCLGSRERQALSTAHQSKPPLPYTSLIHLYPSLSAFFHLFFFGNSLCLHHFSCTTILSPSYFLLFFW